MKTLARLFSFVPFLLFAVLLFAVAAFAQDVITPPSGADILAFLNAIGGLKGAGALVISAVIVQGVMLFVRFSFGEILGKYRLSLMLLLSLVSGFVSLRIAGADVGSALLHPATLAAFQLLFNQIYKQFFVKLD